MDNLLDDKSIIINKLNNEKENLFINLEKLNCFLDTCEYKKFNFTEKYITALFEQRISMQNYYNALILRLELFQLNEVYNEKENK